MGVLRERRKYSTPRCGCTLSLLDLKSKIVLNLSRGFDAVKNRPTDGGRPKVVAAALEWALVARADIVRQARANGASMQASLTGPRNIWLSNLR